MTGSLLHPKLRRELARGPDPVHPGGQIVNRNELVEAVVSRTELRKSEASKAVDAVFESIGDALKGGDEV
ncbi:MAG: HU family DNA-binding protein, partial [Stellaceae bacterium]